MIHTEHQSAQVFDFICCTYPNIGRVGFRNESTKNSLHFFFKAFISKNFKNVEYLVIIFLSVSVFCIVSCIFHLFTVTVDVKKNIYHLACNMYDTSIAIVENLGDCENVDESTVRLYDVGRYRDDDDEGVSSFISFNHQFWR